MIVAGVGSAFPEYLYRQEVIRQALKRHWGENPDRRQLIDRIHSRAGVRQRHLAYPIERYEQFNTWGETNNAWIEAAQSLGEKAIDCALERANLRRHDLDAIYVVSVTGIASPSLDAKLVNRMGLRPDIKRTPIFGLGCVGGAAGMTRAADYVRAYPEQVSVLLSVELCSLTIQRDDQSTANLISTALFADGAVAAIVAGKARGAGGPQILGSRSVFYPDSEDIMGWDISERGFKMVLSQRLPELIKSRLGADVDSFLNALGFGRGDIGNWLIHPGGPRVIEAVEQALDLRNGELDVSWDTLGRFGNLSSGSVLLVLEETMTRRRPAPGTLSLMAAMGPGFCSELILMRW